MFPVLFLFSGKNNDCPVVEEFGSFVMDLFSAESDLDLSVNFSDTAINFPRDKKIQTLRKFSKKLFNLQSNSKMFSSFIYPFEVLMVLECLYSFSSLESLAMLYLIARIVISFLIDFLSETCIK